MIFKAFLLVCFVAHLTPVHSKPMLSTLEREGSDVEHELRLWLNMMYRAETEKLNHLIGDRANGDTNEDDSGEEESGEGAESGEGGNDDSPDTQHDDNGEEESGEGAESGEGGDDDSPNIHHDDSGEEESGEGAESGEGGDDDSPNTQHDDSGEEESGEGAESGEGGDDDYADNSKLVSSRDSISSQRTASHFSRLAATDKRGRLPWKTRETLEDDMIDALLSDYVINSVQK